jgi:transposase
VNHEHIRQCRIVKEGLLYSVVFTVERTLPNGKPLSPSKIAALDPNHRNLAYAVGSDGQAIEIQNPYFLKGLDKRIDALKAKRDRCKKQSRVITRQDGRTCHDCGFVVEEGIPVDVREWDCPHPACACHHIRDENAARNGLKRTRKRVGVALLGPSGGLLTACLAVQRARINLRGSLTDTATGIGCQEIK